MEILATNSVSVGISLDASSNSIKSLLQVLTSGMAFTKEQGDLREAIRTAELLGISIENWQIGKRREKEKPIKIDFCIKLPSRLINKPQETNENGKMKRVRKSKIKHVTSLDESRLRCEICGYESRNSTKIKRHVRTHSNNHKYECESCSYTFKNAESLNNHISIAHSNSNNDIEVEEEVKSEELIKLYTRTSRRRRIGWSCDICGYESRDLTTIKKHVKTHSNNHKYECESCPYTFKNEESLNNHISIAHSGSNNDIRVKEEVKGEEQMELCTHSDACALDSSRIKNEDSESEDNSEMQNTSCSESVNNNNPIIVDEERNMMESEAEEPENIYSLNEAGQYVCLKCGIVIKYRSGFIRHWNAHMGVKFHCDQCGSEFSRRDKLQNHIRNKHSGGRDKPMAGPTGESNTEKSNTDEEN